jgi:membrane fusion protein (multidrug efflux system)
MDNTTASANDGVVLRTPKAPGKTGTIRRVVLLGAALVALVVAAWYGWHWWTVGRFLEATDDAYLQADNVTISPKVGGIVAAVLVDDNQPVKTGDLIARIDERDYQAALDQARANVRSAEADVANLDAQAALQQSMIDQAEADFGSNGAALQFSRQEEGRYKALVANGAGTLQRVQQADSDLQQRTATLAHARAALEAARKQLDVLRTQKDKTEATVIADRAKLAQAELDLEHTRILAPGDGIIGDKSVRAGQFVQPGTRLLTVVPVQDTYLVANFKETQLQHMVPGEHVEIEIDTFPGTVITGTVVSLAPGSGSQFSLLPPENATGNFTKIVQRVPVKIAIDKDNPLAGLLRPGLSVTATVDTRSGRADGKASATDRL